MIKHIRTLTVIYDNEINNSEVQLFRGAVLKSLGDDADLLYHNHTGEETFRYSYPLIQYKRLRGKAAIVCVEQGVDMIGQFLTSIPEELQIGQRTIQPKVEMVQPNRMVVQTWDSKFRYHLNRWLPLNAQNYQKYKETESMSERIQLLESILKGNLLSFLKGLDIHLENELTVSITNLGDSFLISNKGIKMMAFNADFISNLSIPNNLGIGKNASIGYGIVRQYKNDSEKKSDNQE